jgi:hypothetical protein
MKRLIVLVVLMAVNKLQSQNVEIYDNQNAWVNHTLTYGFLPKYSFHSEVQWRRENWIQHPQQFLLRYGITRELNNGLSVTAGYCYVHTSPYGKIPAKAAFPENRGWIQLQQKNVRGRIELVERIRIEQRWVHTPIINPTTQIYEAGDAVYSNRARFLQRFNIALNKNTIENGTVYLAMWDEFFAAFGKNVPTNVFDQNRAFAGLGIQLPKLGRLELGYLNQLINKGYFANAVTQKVVNKREQNNILSFALYTNVPYQEKKQGNSPTQ